MSRVYRKMIEEDRIKGKELGRSSILHDPKSWRYPAPMADKVVSVHHEIDILLDQGADITLGGRVYHGLGSCVGNAETYMLMSDKFIEHTHGVTEGRDLDESDAVEFYSRATHIDHYRGVFPSDDTGSNGLSVMKAGKDMGFIDGYAHCFSLDHFLRTLTLQPTITGSYWKTGMDDPDQDGVIHYAGATRGGHEFVQCGLIIQDPKYLAQSPHNLVECKQSWGQWGKAVNGKPGYFYLPIPEYATLLHDQGDVKTGVLL